MKKGVGHPQFRPKFVEKGVGHPQFIPTNPLKMAWDLPIHTLLKRAWGYELGVLKPWGDTRWGYSYKVAGPNASLLYGFFLRGQMCTGTCF